MTTRPERPIRARPPRRAPLVAAGRETLGPTPSPAPPPRPHPGVTTHDPPPGRDAAKRLPLLDLLPDDIRQLVEATAETRRYGFGDVVVRQGTDANGIYTVVDGRARVVIADDDGEELPVTTLGQGDTFGAQAAVDGGVRTATVRAMEPLVCHRLDGAVLRGLARTNPEVAEALRLDLRRTELNELFHAFPSFVQLSDQHMRQLLTEVEDVTVAAGDRLVTTGEPAGPLYVITSGRLVASIDGRNVSFLRTGDVVGERSLLLGEARSADVTAIDDAELLALPVATYQRLLDADDHFARAMATRVDQYEYKTTARVPVDFASELLPAEVREESSERRIRDRTDRRSETLRGAEAAAAATATPTPFAVDGVFVKQPGRIKRFKHRYQVDEADCGAACIAMVSAHHGKRLGLSQAREAAGTGADGSSLAGIVRAGETLGMHARSVKASPSNLDAMPLPAIVHWEGIHWVVLVDVTDKQVTVADPAIGMRKLARADFLESWTGYAALLEPGDGFETSKGTRGRLSWAGPFIRQGRRSLFIALGLSMLSSAGAMVVPLLTQSVVDRVLLENDESFLTVIVVGLVGTVVVLTIVNLAESIVLTRGANDLDRSTLRYLSNRLLKLPMSYFNARRTGDIQARLGSLEELRGFVVDNILAVVTSILNLVFALLLMLRISPWLTLVWLAIMPIYVAMLRVSGTRLRPLFDLLEETTGRYSSKQIDAIKGIETVKANSAEESLERQMGDEFELVIENRYRVDKTSLTFEGILETLQTLSLGLFLFIGARQVLDGNVSIGEFVSFNAFVALATGPILYLLGLWDDVQDAGITLTRLEDIFDAEPEQGDDHSHLLPVRSLEGRVTLDGVGFRYGGEGSPTILHDISLDIAAGTTVAIVGRSGSGKSTLAKLLGGLLEPTEGEIRYDGVPMQQLVYRDLRRHIGVVLQDTYVFADTIASNISLGDLEASPERVEWAAKVAAAHSFIHRLPLAYDTVIGEGGLRLSGGQTQRIAIARAVYERPAVLLMDEATSALDVESERAVQENMDQLLEGRTAFVVAHRLSTIRNADLIVVVDEGSVAEQGTHDELMDRRGLYSTSSQQLES